MREQLEVEQKDKPVRPLLVLTEKDGQNEETKANAT
jgi:hypothetical protein